MEPDSNEQSPPDGDRPSDALEEIAESKGADGQGQAVPEAGSVEESDGAKEPEEGKEPESVQELEEAKVSEEGKVSEEVQESEEGEASEEVKESGQAKGSDEGEAKESDGAKESEEGKQSERVQESEEAKELEKVLEPDGAGGAEEAIVSEEVMESGEAKVSEETQESDGGMEEDGAKDSEEGKDSDGAKESSEGGAPPLAEPLSRRGPGPEHVTPTWLSGVYAGLCLYFFVSAINVMGHGLKTLGKSSDFIERLMDAGHNPVVGLLGGLVVTAVVQSSSFTTSLIITLVAAGQMDMESAIYAIMGANIGTSITNNLVCIGTFRIRRQFRRAYSAALMHGNVNFLTVGVLFPLEWITSSRFDGNGGILMHSAAWMAEALNLEPGEKPNNLIKMMTKPVVSGVDWVVDVVGGWFSLGTQAGAIAVAVIGLLVLFTALVLLVTNLKGALLKRVEGLFSSVLFRNDATSGAVGFLSTVMVQSSSVTTSLIIPLAGAGAVKSTRVFPFMLGCNVGTTITGVIAATANPVAAAVSVAIAHVFFNLIGVVIWYPLRVIPIGLARWYARKAATKKIYYFLFLGVVYGVLPIIGWFLSAVVFKGSG